MLFVSVHTLRRAPLLGAFGDNLFGGKHVAISVHQFIMPEPENTSIDC